MTDNEIVKALERMSEEYPDGFSASILDLINRLKAKNKEFDEKIVMQMGTIDWQAKEINSLKAEIEGLEDAKNAYKDIVDTCEAGAIKNFAERLKERKQAFPRADGVVHAVTISKIDNLLAEMVGDNNVQSSN